MGLIVMSRRTSRTSSSARRTTRTSSPRPTTIAMGSRPSSTTAPMAARPSPMSCFRAGIPRRALPGYSSMCRPGAIRSWLLLRTAHSTIPRSCTTSATRIAPRAGSRSRLPTTAAPPGAPRLWSTTTPPTTSSTTRSGSRPARGATFTSPGPSSIRARTVPATSLRTSWRRCPTTTVGPGRARSR